MNSKEILSRILSDDEERRRAASNAADGAHLLAEDFETLIAEQEKNRALDGDRTDSPTRRRLQERRQHLANCNRCLEDFRDYYAFFAPPEQDETLAGKARIETSWQSFAPLLSPEKSAQKKSVTGFFDIFRGGFFFTPERIFAAACLLIAGIVAAAWWQTRRENSQLAAQFEREKIAAQKRLETPANSSTNAQSDQPVAAPEPTLTNAEKTALESQIAELERQIARLKRDQIAAPPNAPANREIAAVRNPPVARRGDADPTVAVNTPIYDVFPADRAVRSGDREQANTLRVPQGARTIVLILNAVGQSEQKNAQIIVTDAAGKFLRRGGNLRRDANGNFTLSLSGALLKSGNYRLKLVSGNETFAEYPFSLAPE